MVRNVENIDDLFLSIVCEVDGTLVRTIPNAAIEYVLACFFDFVQRGHADTLINTAARHVYSCLIGCACVNTISDPVDILIKAACARARTNGVLDKISAGLANTARVSESVVARTYARLPLLD